MLISDAPGGCLRRWLTQSGYPIESQRHAGRVSRTGYDPYTHRIVFPLEGNLYGSRLSTAAPPHRFLQGFFHSFPKPPRSYARTFRYADHDKVSWRHFLYYRIILM